MEEQKKKQNGITLIALVISIIVMLILAGVSLNMTIGDDGIISQAQAATYTQSCAVLKEYLNQLYINDYADDKLNEENLSKTELEKLLELHSNLFFFNNTYDYVLTEGKDKEGNDVFLKLRLIRKVQLDDDIRKEIKGGDANGDDSDAYLSLKDVYGVTDDLDVYYCYDGISSAVGADFNNSSSLNASLVMYEKNSGLSKAIATTLGSESKDITLAEARSLQNLTISSDTGLKNLKFLFDMPNITRITLQDYEGSLEGIGSAKKLTYIYFYNSTGKQKIDYTDFRNATGLKELYFYMPTDTELSNMCTEMSNSTYSQLETIGIYGYEIERRITDVYYSSHNLRGYRSNLTSVSYLDLLNQDTKNAVKVMYLHNNKLTSLNGIQNFYGIQKLYINNNNFADTTGTIEVDGESQTVTNYAISSYIAGMNSLSSLYCGWSTASTNDIDNISNTSITYFSCPGLNLSKIDVVTKFTSLRQIQCTNNSSMTLAATTVTKLAGLSVCYIDGVYSTKLALANITSEVYLGTDATNDDMEQLRGKTQVTILEIPSNTKITDDKLQSVLPTLTNLTGLDADSSKLASLNWIPSNSKLEWISICGTTITDLSKLSNCSNLYGLRINTTGLNLKPYSTMISNICNKGRSKEHHLKCGSLSVGGMNAPASILNTLNGTATDKNTNLTTFSCYWGGHSSGQLVDFTNTSLTTVKILYDDFILRVPSTFTTFTASACAGVTIDYTNLTSSTSYNASQVKSSNYTNFTGYQTVYSIADAYNIIGTNTISLAIGTRYTDYRSEKKAPYYTRDFSACVTKAPNITNLALIDVLGLDNFEVFKTLKLTDLRCNYCSVQGLNFIANSNLATNLQNLTITNSYLSKLDGLHNLTKLQTLNLEENRLENYVTIINSSGKEQTMKTSKYIADSVPSTCKTIYLGGNSELTDFTDLVSAGFSETSNGSRTFTRP